MTISERITVLRKKMKQHQFDAYYIPTSDPHQCEYLAEHDKTRVFISGFTGSAGTVLVTDTEALLWTDGRYFLQAEKELAGTGIILQKSGEPGVPTLFEYIQQTLPAESSIGMDGSVVSVETLRAFSRSLPTASCVIDCDLIGEFWEERPAPVLSTAFVLGTQYTGASPREKITEVRKMLRQKKADATVIGALEDVCYLFNIRGRDIESTPVVTSYAIVTMEKAYLYIDERQLTESVREYLEKEGVTIQPYTAVFEDAAQLKGTVYFDPARINVLLYQCLQGKTIEGLNITSEMKAVKNPTEIENCRTAFAKDGAAMVKMLKWLEAKAADGITECDVADQLERFRAEQKDFIEPSFTTIAGYGPNGAIIHYAPQKATAAVLKPQGFLLLDSGGHYLDGTTDITRTIPLGPLTEDEKRDYTLVLKAHIQLAMAVFPENTLGYKLDAFSRMPLWKYGKDYKHGTGHGVGYVLSVHEGPHTIGLKYVDYPMRAGMLTSNEPGLYCAGAYGIRIENITLTQYKNLEGLSGFLEFETLTVCPIDTRPILKDLLHPEEIQWLNDYHKRVYEVLAPYLDCEHQAFLKERTAEL